MQKIVIFGSGAHAKVIFSEIIENKKISFLGFVDASKRKGKVIAKYKNKNFCILGSIDQVLKKKNIFKGIIGVGLNFLRHKIYNEILKKDKKFKFYTMISKDAILKPNVKIGPGSVILSKVIINTNTIIGDHNIIYTSSTIEHDNLFKDFCSTGPRVTTGGKVFVDSLSHLGIGSVIKNDIKIRKNCLIGAKSLIINNCKQNTVYFGAPAKKIRIKKYNENYLR